MIVGQFREHFPRLPVELPAEDGMLEIEFVLDTGFEGNLTLPAAIVRELDAPNRGSQFRLLADGSSVECAINYLDIDWNGESRRVEILVLETNPLLGTLLLDGCHLDIEMTEGGEVIVEYLQ